MESGPSPDTASFVQKIEEEKLAKERGETKDNRSFFAKYVWAIFNLPLLYVFLYIRYWMYIIPFVLVLAMSGGGQEGGGGR